MGWGWLVGVQGGCFCGGVATKKWLVGNVKCRGSKNEGPFISRGLSMVHHSLIHMTWGGDGWLGCKGVWVTTKKWLVCVGGEER